MTLHLAAAATERWRPARATDLASIDHLASRIHPAYPERPAVFAGRLASHPSGVMLAVLDGSAVGYAIGHPWRGAPPELDRVIGALPALPDGYWVHDVALLPAARGAGLGRAALELLGQDALRCGLRTLRLVAVGEAEPFWRRAGFLPTGETLPLSYGKGAIGMRRQA